MNNSILCLALAVVAVLSIVEGRRTLDLKFDVEQFEVETEEHQLFDFLMSPGLARSSSRVGSYSYKNCEDVNKEEFVIKDVVVGPDPLSFPGDLTINFDGTIKTVVDAPLKAVLTISRRVGSAWIKIPCIGSIGSCTYADLCEMLSSVTCPPPLVNNKIPCKCPFPAGSYSLPKTTFEVLAAVFPPGDYHFTANLTTTNDAPVTCADLHASFV